MELRWETLSTRLRFWDPWSDPGEVSRDSDWRVGFKTEPFPRNPLLLGDLKPARNLPSTKTNNPSWRLRTLPPKIRRSRARENPSVSRHEEEKAIPSS